MSCTPFVRHHAASPSAPPKPPLIARHPETCRGVGGAGKRGGDGKTSIGAQLVDDQARLAGAGKNKGGYAVLCGTGCHALICYHWWLRGLLAVHGVFHHLAYFFA